MKLRHLLLGMFAIAATVACDPVEPEVAPELDVNKTEASVTADGGSVSVQVTANVDWAAAADKDWVSLDPASGNGNATVTLTVAPNEAEEARTANVTVKADKLSKTVKITQAGKAADPTPDPTPDPELELSDWAVVGSFTGEGWGWDPGAGVPLYVLDADYFVVYGLELPAEAQFKFLQGGAWGGAEVGADRTSVEPNTIQQKGGSNIYLAAGGTYDIYLSSDATKYYIMSVGKTPADATEPSAAEVTFTVTGTLQDNNWNNMASAGLMNQEGGYYVAKNVPFVTAATLYGGADQIEFKICNTGSWDGAYGAAAEGTYGANSEIAVAVNGGNIAVVAPEGAYDVYFDKDNGKVWVMTPGYKPGDQVPGGEEPEYTLDGKQWMAEVDGMPVLFDFGIAEEGFLCVALPSMDGSSFALYMAGLYEITPSDAASGVVTFIQYDWEWEEFMGEVQVPYSELGATSVKVSAEGIFGVSDFVTLTLVENPYEITIGGGGSGEGPQGAIADGAYWFVNNGKVMNPLAAGETVGYFSALDTTTAENTFVFTYDPDYSVYTIQDSYGRYLGHTDWETDRITASESLPTGEDMWLYYWVVEDFMDGTMDVYNIATYFGIVYSADNNHWYLDENSYAIDGIRPSLVSAE